MGGNARYEADLRWSAEARLVARSLADCEALAGRIALARRTWETGLSGELMATLAGAEADLELYVGLLAQRVARLAAEPFAAAVHAARSTTYDVSSLDDAIRGFIGDARAAAEEAPLLGDIESAGLLAEIARVGETWLWGLEVPTEWAPSSYTYSEALPQS